MIPVDQGAGSDDPGLDTALLLRLRDGELREALAPCVRPKRLGARAKGRPLILALPNGARGPQDGQAADVHQSANTSESHGAKHVPRSVYAIPLVRVEAPACLRRRMHRHLVTTATGNGR